MRTGEKEVPVFASGFHLWHHARSAWEINGMDTRDTNRTHLIGLADLLARVLDTTVKIPGTSLYLGLDPVLGLIPGIGDAIASLIGTIILGLGTRLQVPKIVLARMSLNLLINGAIGAVPIVGDLFSIWFRSHARNAVLLREAVSRPERETHHDWFYVGGIIAGTVLLLLLTIGATVWLVMKLWKMLLQL
jgi:hypothetical protein